MRFFFLFMLCFFAAEQNAHAKNIDLQELGIEAQIIESVEGISPCKAGGDIIQNLGKWLRLERDGKVFAQTCVYENWNISLAEADGVRFFQVESSKDGQKLLSLLSDQGMTLHVFHTDGKGLKERRTKDGKLLYVWEGDYDYTYETLVGKNEISTINKTEQDGDPRWTNLTLEDLIYLGPDGKGMAGTGCGHLFRTKDGQELRLIANAGGQDKFFWDWMLKRQGKLIRVLRGNYDIGPGFGGPSIYEAMPGLAQNENDRGSAPYYNDRYGFALTWLPENCTVQESDNGDGTTVRLSEGFTLLAYGTQSYAVMGQSMEEAANELSQGLQITYKTTDTNGRSFTISGFAGDELVYIKCFFGKQHACIIRMTYPKTKAKTYAPQVLKIIQSVQIQK